jgi:hypothetical protein
MSFRQTCADLTSRTLNSNHVLVSGPPSVTTILRVSFRLKELAQSVTALARTPRTKRKSYTSSKLDSRYMAELVDFREVAPLRHSLPRFSVINLN